MSNCNWSKLPAGSGWVGGSKGGVVLLTRDSKGQFYMILPAPHSAQRKGIMFNAKNYTEAKRIACDAASAVYIESAISGVRRRRRKR